MEMVGSDVVQSPWKPLKHQQGMKWHQGTLVARVEGLDGGGK
jgi:hypothetical protein